MSAFETQMYANMNKVPTHQLEKIYWRRKLPPGLHFYLEMVSRELMLSQPENIHLHAAGFFQNLLMQRRTEISMLPLRPYLDRLKRKRGLIPKPEFPKVSFTPQPVCIKCVRCGRWLQRDDVDNASAAETADRPTSTHMEGYDQCTVMALDSANKGDSFGKTLIRYLPGEKGEEIITCRSLSYLVDY